MNAYIWDSLEDVTDNYHSSGGVLVIADSLEAARAAIPRIPWGSAKKPPSEVGYPNMILHLADDLIFPTPYVRIFPDSGCC